MQSDQTGQKWGGYLLISLSALCWGLSATLAKFLFRHEVGPLILVQTRASLSFVILALVILFFRPAALKIRAADLPALSLLGVVRIAGANFFYYYTIAISSVATGVILQYTAPVWVLLGAVALKWDRLHWRKGAGVLLAWAGCILAVGWHSRAGVAGSTLAFVTGILAALCFAFFNLYGRRLIARYSLWTILCYSLAATTFFWLLINPPWALWNAGYSPDQWFTFLWFAVLSILLPYTFYSVGLRQIGPTRAITVSTLEPIVGIVSAYVIVGESLGFVQLLGAGLVLSAILLTHRG